MFKIRAHVRYAAVGLAFACLGTFQATAQTDSTSSGSIFDMDLEALMQIEIFSASKKAESSLILRFPLLLLRKKKLKKVVPLPSKM